MAVPHPQVNMYAPGIAYQALGNLVSATLALTPLAYRLAQHRDLEQLGSLSADELVRAALGCRTESDVLVATMVTLSLVVRACLTWLFFFLLSVAERTYKQVMRVEGGSKRWLLTKTELAHVDSQVVTREAEPLLTLHLCRSAA